MAFLGFVWRVYSHIANWWGPGVTLRRAALAVLSGKTLILKILIFKARYLRADLKTLHSLKQYLNDLPEAKPHKESNIYYYVKGHKLDGAKLELSHLDIKGTIAKRAFRPDVAFSTRKLRGRNGAKFYAGFAINESTLAQSLGANLDYTNEHLRNRLYARQSSNRNFEESVLIDECGISLTAFSLNPSIEELFVKHHDVILRVIETTGTLDLATRILSKISKYNQLWLDELSLQKLLLFSSNSSGNDTQERRNEKSGEWQTKQLAEPSWKNSEVFGPFQPQNAFTRSFRRSTTIEKVFVQNGGTIFNHELLYNTDYAQNPAFDFVAGRWNHVVGSHLTLYKARVKNGSLGFSQTIPQAIILSSRCEDNWFHWMIETLPRILLVEDVDSDVPILISNRVSQAGVEALRAISDREIIRINETKPTFVLSAHIPGQVIFHPDSLEFWRTNIFSIFDTALLETFRDKIIGGLKLERNIREKRIFITRRSTHRNLTHISSIEKVLTKVFKFEIVDTSQLSLDDQIRTVMDAKSIIMVGGAGMANLLFAAEGCKVAVLYPKSARGFDIQEKIGLVAKSETRTFFGPSLSAFYFNRYSKIHANFSLTPPTWFRVLKHVLSSRIA